MIAEFIEVASLRLGCGPGAFNESFPQVSVSVCSAPCLDLSGTFLIARLQSTPGHKVGAIFERLHIWARFGDYGCSRTSLDSGYSLKVLQLLRKVLLTDGIHLRLAFVLVLLSKCDFFT